ncbi:hypothetical protein IFVP22_C220474 [Vibrio parahaemolyticus]
MFSPQSKNLFWLLLILGKSIRVRVWKDIEYGRKFLFLSYQHGPQLEGGNPFSSSKSGLSE